MKKAMILVMALITVPVVHVLAQRGLGTDPGTGAPIDGGISLLVAAGVGPYRRLQWQ